MQYSINDGYQTKHFLIQLKSIVSISRFFKLDFIRGLVRWRYNVALRLESNSIGKEYQQLWQEIRDKVQEINDVNTSVEREGVFAQINAMLGAITFRHIDPDYIHYMKSASEIWSDLNPEHLNDAVSVMNGKSEYSEAESTNYVRAFIPPIALLREDLLPEVEKRIEKPYRQLKAIQYAYLAICLKDDNQLSVIHKSIAAFEEAEFAESAVPYILSLFIEHTPFKTYALILNQMVLYPSIEPLVKIAPKIVHDENLLSQAYQIAEKIDDSTSEFITVIASELDKDWLLKILAFLLRREKTDEQKDSYPALVKRWLELSHEEAHWVWCEFLPLLKTYPRGYVMEQLYWLAQVIHYLGGVQGIDQVAEEVNDITQWWGQTYSNPPNETRHFPV